MSHVSIDFETFFSKRLKYSVKTSIAEQYCRSDLFDAYLISVCDGSHAWAGPLKDFNWSSLDGQTLVSHNRFFDNTVYNELVTRGLAPKLNFKAWHCTSNLTAYLCNRRALAHAVEHLYKVKLSKAVREDSDNKRWPNDFSAEQQKAMIEYGRSDALWCWRLWNDYADKWPDHEKRLSNLTIEQGMRGVQINTQLLDNYLMWSHEMKINTEKLLPWLQDADDDQNDWEGFNLKPTSTKCIAEQCRRSGIPCPPVKSHFDDGEEMYAEWETLYAPKNPWIAALSSWRSINKLYKSFQTVKARLRPDGTMPFSLKYFGAHTGRWSGDAGLNMQNMRKKPIYCNEHGLMETDEKRKEGDWIRYAIDFRHLIIPRPGKKLIVSDLSQIEPRCLAWLAGDEKALEFVRSGKSIYEAEARFSMGFTGEILDPDSMIYAEAKARRLALGYGAGWEKFLVMAQDYTGMDLSADDPEWVVDSDGKQVSGYGQRAKQIVAAYRAQNPLIADKEKGIWAKLEKAFKRSVGSDFQVVLPSGRVLRYEKVRCERKLKPDRDGKPCMSTVFTMSISDRRFETYSGKLTENLTQAVARDVFGYHLLKLEDAGHTNLFSSHDEAILECDLNVTAKSIEKIMSECPEWISGLPVAAKAKEVPHYLK